MVAPSEQDKLEPEGVPAEELEAKLLSVRKALERFDDVKVWSRVPLIFRYSSTKFNGLHFVEHLPHALYSG